jgi:hypothetical protein
MASRHDRPNDLPTLDEYILQAKHVKTISDQVAELDARAIDALIHRARHRPKTCLHSEQVKDSTLCFCML